MATAELVLTAEEYHLLPENGQPTELVRGRIVPLNMPAPKHGWFCSNIVGILRNFVRQHDLGRVMSNDSGVVTERSPDTVRGADVAYYSYQRIPRGPLPEGYFPVAPELVFEVRSPSDRWTDILAKVVEYLNAGVLVVGVHDAQTRTLTLYRPNEVQQVLTVEDELLLPELYAAFRMPVGPFFEE